MKKKLKVIVAISLVVVFLTAFMGCGTTNPGPTATPENQGPAATSEGEQTTAVTAGGEGSTIDRILKEGKLRVVCILSTSPFGMTNTQGKPEGFDVDIAYALGESLGVEVEIIDSVEAANRVPYIQSGKADVCIATLGATLERAQVISFTDPYIRDGQVIVAAKGSTIKTLDDLKGKKVGLVRGGPQDLIAEQYLKDSEVSRYGSVADTFTALKQGKVEAVVEGLSISNYQVAQAMNEIEVVSEPFTTLYWAFGVAKGDNDWVNYLNLFIKDLNISGKRVELYKKWFNGIEPVSLTVEY